MIEIGTAVGSLVAAEVFSSKTRYKTSNAETKLIKIKSCRSLEVSSTAICSILRLVRLLGYMVDAGDFSAIGAALGCPIAMPANLLSMNRAEFNTITDPLEKTCILNCLFVTVNWIREVINAFCISEDPDYRQKV
jgi:hypothetical protein